MPVVIGLMWHYVSLVITAILHIVVLTILSRLLSPYEFGLVGIASIFVTLATLISQMGVGPAIVQRHDLSVIHERVGVTLSCLLGGGITLILYICAPFVANFFGNEEVIRILRIQSLTFILSSVGTVSQSVLQKNFKFKQLMLIDVASYVIGYAIVGIGLAYFGKGVWSLIGAQLVQSFTSSLLSCWFYPSPLGISIKFQEAKDLLRFGVGFTLARLFNYVANQGDYFVVGKVFGPTWLGLYTRAYQIMMLPVQYVGVALEKVLFPVISKIQSEKPRVKNFYLVNTYLVVLFCAPLSVWLFVCAPEVVDVLLGSQWEITVMPLRILSSGVLFRTAYKLGDSVAKATGAVYQRSVRELLYAFLVIFGALVGSILKLPGVAIGVLLAIIVNYAMAATLSKKILGFPWREYIGAHIPGIWLSLSLFLSLLPFHWFMLSIKVNSFFVLVLSVVFSLGITFGTIIAFPQVLGAYAVLIIPHLLRFLSKKWRVRPIFGEALHFVELKLSAFQRRLIGSNYE